MDGGERRQSQYGAPYQPSNSGRPAPGQPMGPPPQDQYSRTASSPARSNLPRESTYVPNYGYSYQPSQFTPQLHYPPSYVSDPARGQQLPNVPSQPHYAPYGQGSMLPPVGQPSMYESTPSYQQQRQSTAIEVMTGQFGGSGFQYDSSGAVGVGPSHSQYLSSQPEQQPYSSMSYARPQLQPPFTPQTDYSMLEPSAAQQTPEEVTSRQASEEGKRQYEQQIRATFDAIIAGRVTEASEKLVAITDWLLGSVRALGLHHDDEESHGQRLVLWRELNHAWEALGLKQKTVTETAVRTRQQPADYLSANAIQNLVEKLIQLCDQIEKFGLVDYEMGIWEEQIVDIFVQCLNLLPEEQPRSRPGSNH